MNTSKTIQITQYGGPEVLQLVELPVGEPARSKFTTMSEP